MKSFMVAIFLVSSTLVGVDVDNYCIGNGGYIHDVLVNNRTVSLCRFVECEFFGHDGVCYAISECEKEAFFAGNCDKRNCASIDVSVDIDGAINLRCQEFDFN